LHGSIPPAAEAAIDLRSYGMAEAVPFPNKVKLTHYGSVSTSGDLASFVICRQFFLRVTLGLIVIDPELRMFLCDDCRYLVHGLERGLLVPVIVRDVAMFEACLKMHNIAA
jgi:hypothetical protein